MKKPSPRLSEPALLEAIQRQTFGFFWDGAEKASLLARDRCTLTSVPANDLVAVGGSGFGIMALIVAVERRWVTRKAATVRLARMLDCLTRATCYHGAFPHFLQGKTGATIAFSRKDDGGDLVETSFLMMGLITARQYFDKAEEGGLRGRINQLWEEVEWNWYTQGADVLTWHWSPNNGFALNHQIRGWNETLITYVLAAGAPRYAIDAKVYENGFCQGADYRNDKIYYGVTLPLGPDLSGPLFFAHYSFCGLDPHGLQDRHADYWQQNLAQVRINLAHCAKNPNGFKSYSADCWGITASDDPGGYDAHAPGNDNGTISPTAALSSFPYAPEAAMRALRYFLKKPKIWGGYGFVDAFNDTKGWRADTYLAIDQGPIVVMIENYRSGLLWKLFMSAPEVKRGLIKLGFTSPAL